MSVSVLDQYLRVVPTLGVQASQTQYVNNLRAGYETATSTDRSLLNLFSVDGVQRSVVNIVSKTGTRIYAGAGQNDADFLIPGTLASTQFAEFAVNNATATLHVPELSGSTLRLGAAGTANAATMTYLTLTNAAGANGAFQRLSTTANYLELASQTAANCVMISGANGIKVENQGTNALIAARTGDLRMQANTGANLFATANAGIHLLTDQGNYNINATGGSGFVQARDVLSLGSTAGDVGVRSMTGNTTVSAQRLLYGTGNVVTLQASSAMNLLSNGSFTMAATGNVNLQSIADSINLDANRFIQMSANLRDIDHRIRTGQFFPGHNASDAAAVENAQLFSYLYTINAAKPGGVMVRITLRYTHDGINPMTVDADPSRSFIEVTYANQETYLYTVSQAANSTNQMDLFLFRNGNRIGSLPQMRVTFVENSSTDNSKVFLFVINSFQEGFITLTAKGGMALRTEQGELRLDSGDSISMTARNLIEGHSRGNVTFTSLQRTTIQSTQRMSLSTGANLLVTTAGNTIFETSQQLLSNAASSRLFTTGDSVFRANANMLAETLTGELRLNAANNRLLLNAAQNIEGTSGANISLIAAQNLTGDAVAGRMHLTSQQDFHVASRGANVVVNAITGHYNLTAAQSISETAQTGDVTIRALAGNLTESAANAVSLTAQTGTMTLQAQRRVQVTSLAESINLNASAASITGTAQNLTWTSMDTGSPFVVTQQQGTLHVGGILPPGLDQNVHLFVQGNSVFYGNVNIRGELNRVVTNEVVLEVRDKIITLGNTDIDQNNVISNFDQHNAGLQLKTPNAAGQGEHSKYMKWFSSGSGPSDDGYLKAMGILDNNTDASRWVLRGGDLWLERSVRTLDGSVRHVAFGFVITRDLRLALVRRTGTYDTDLELGPANMVSANFETMQFFGTAVRNMAGLGTGV